MAGELYDAGADIEAGASVLISDFDGKAYPVGQCFGRTVGVAIERCREGLRLYVKDGEVREDDA